MPKERKLVTLGLKLGEIGLDELEEIANRVQDLIEELLQKYLPISRSYSADVIVSLENKGDRIDAYIDIGIYGELEDVIDYDAVLQKIIREASKRIEQELSKYTWETS